MEWKIMGMRSVVRNILAAYGANRTHCHLNRRSCSMRSIAMSNGSIGNWYPRRAGIFNRIAYLTLNFVDIPTDMMITWSIVEEHQRGRTGGDINPLPHLILFVATIHPAHGVALHEFFPW